MSFFIFYDSPVNVKYYQPVLDLLVIKMKYLRERTKKGHYGR